MLQFGVVALLVSLSSAHEDRLSDIVDGVPVREWSG